MRHIDPTAGHTCGPVKHPCRDFQKPVRPAAGKIAPQHRIAGLVDRLMDMNKSTKPGMPSIKNLAALSNVGVLTFSCTTSTDRTARTTERRLTKRSEKSYNQPTRCPASNRTLHRATRWGHARQVSDRKGDNLLEPIFAQDATLPLKLGKRGPDGRMLRAKHQVAEVCSSHVINAAGADVALLGSVHGPPRSSDPCSIHRASGSAFYQVRRGPDTPSPLWFLPHISGGGVSQAARQYHRDRGRQVSHTSFPRRRHKRVACLLSGVMSLGICEGQASPGNAP